MEMDSVMDDDPLDPEEAEPLSHFSFAQLAIYNNFGIVLNQFLREMTEPKDLNDLSTWNGVFISQYPTIKRALFPMQLTDRCEIVALIAKLNFDVDELTPELLDNIMNLIHALEEEPWEFGMTEHDADDDDGPDIDPHALSSDDSDDSL